MPSMRCPRARASQLSHPYNSPTAGSNDGVYAAGGQYENNEFNRPESDPSLFLALPSEPSSYELVANKPGKIPRPPNCFVIFRSEFCKNRLLHPVVESKSDNISRIAGHIWRCMDEAKKDKYREKARIAKVAHAKAYPDYKFIPKSSKTRDARRMRVEEDIVKCRKVGELMIDGVQGEELKIKAKNLDLVKLTARTEKLSKSKMRDTASIPTLVNSHTYDALFLTARPTPSNFASLGAPPQESMGHLDAPLLKPIGLPPALELNTPSGIGLNNYDAILPDFLLGKFEPIPQGQYDVVGLQNQLDSVPSLPTDMQAIEMQKRMEELCLFRL